MTAQTSLRRENPDISPTHWGPRHPECKPQPQPSGMLVASWALALWFPYTPTSRVAPHPTTESTLEQALPALVPSIHTLLKGQGAGCSHPTLL